ncbi:MAG: OmpA/MotB domain-containing protein [Bacteroidetes bacterium]|nr:MAG: OmpA/MotB domain-containing protein [Bacteroidota bacterium]
MKNIFIPIIALACTGMSGFAQEKSNKELKGDEYAFNYSFDKAIVAYTQARQLTPDGQRRLAESYCNMDQHAESEAAYARLINIPGDVVADDYYNYAMVLKTNGKYAEANESMDKFSALKPEDSRAKNYSANNTGLTGMMTDNGRYKIQHLDINTDAQDFGACYYGDKVVFASTRATPKWIQKKYNWNRKPFLDMRVSEVNGGQLHAPENFSKRLNGKLHDGTACFSNNGTHMAFTSNNASDRSKDRIVELQIFFSTYTDGKWSEEEPFVLNDKGYSVGQPCLTPSGNTMYFTSDKPGGYGGADIYRITKDEKGTWGNPENLGNKINTEGNEMFPFFEESNDVLFFTSDGHFGLGGLDIFICAVNGAEFGRVYNAGTPLNTQYDDFAAIVNNKMSRGYFSSNRTGGSGDDNIYSFDLLKALDIGKKIKGIAMDKNGTPVPGTFVSLADDAGNVINTLVTKDDGTYTFLVDPDKNFFLTGKKQNYIDGRISAGTFGNELIIVADLILLKKEEAIVVKIEVGADLGKIVAFNSVYFDFHEFGIRPDAEIELDKIIAIMNEYPGMIVELSSYADCRASKGYNQALSDKRANASAEYVKKRITNPGRIYGKGYGETKPVNGCACESDIVSVCPEDEHQKNRRTEFIIIRE